MLALGLYLEQLQLRQSKKYISRLKLSYQPLPLKLWPTTLCQGARSLIFH